MSTGCPIVGSSTAPVEEVLIDHHNGLLCDFFNPQRLAESVGFLLEDRQYAAELGANARKTIMKQYELTTCVHRHINLIRLVQAGGLRS